ncbi:MAG: glycosyltransferase [Dehalococcoidia bacterium]|nr:glycosyltransferase [Dehalococcoidia bacterium]
MKVSVVLPVHSEGEVLREVVRQIQQALGNKLHEIIIVVSPSSPSYTMEICRDLERSAKNVHVHQQVRNPGLGYAFREGFEHASGSHVLIMSSDGETPAEAIPKMVSKMEQTNCDVVIASRWVDGGKFIGYDPIKYQLNKLFHYIFRMLYRTKVKDLTFGFKIMRTEIAKQMAWESQFHDICIETTVLPLKAGFHLEEVPVVWQKRTSGRSKNLFHRNFLYATRALKVLFKKSGSLYKSINEN